MENRWSPNDVSDDCPEHGASVNGNTQRNVYINDWGSSYAPNYCPEHGINNDAIPFYSGYNYQPDHCSVHGASVSHNHESDVCPIHGTSNESVHETHNDIGHGVETKPIRVAMECANHRASDSAVREPLRIKIQPVCPSCLPTDQATNSIEPTGSDQPVAFSQPLEDVKQLETAVENLLIGNPLNNPEPFEDKRMTKSNAEVFQPGLEPKARLRWQTQRPRSLKEPQSVTHTNSQGLDRELSHTEIFSNGYEPQNNTVLPSIESRKMNERGIKTRPENDKGSNGEVKSNPYNMSSKQVRTINSKEASEIPSFARSRLVGPGRSYIEKDGTRPAGMRSQNPNYSAADCFFWVD